MPNRYIREGINSSRAVASLDAAAEVIYRRMIGPAFRSFSEGGTHRGKKSVHAQSPKPPGAPTLAEVHAYAKEKWGTEPGCANWAASFYTHWNARARQWKRNDIPIDWKIELSQQVARWRKS